jgi:hypothetical protein
MDEMLLKEVLKEASKYIKDPDLLLDAYDLTICWVSDYVKEKSGFSEKEISEAIGQRIINYENVSEEQARKDSVEDMSRGEGIKVYPSKTKKGPMLFEYKYKVFQYKSVHYWIGKLMSVKPVEEKVDGSKE